MTAYKEIEAHRCWGGKQLVVEHHSEATGTPMRVGMFIPPGAGPFPTITFLSGLTCTEQNFITKSSFQRCAAELGLVVVAPDTSPRGIDLPGEHANDGVGSGAGFYVDATQQPWADNYRMYSYIRTDVQALLRHFPVEASRQGIMGHSMGGHGALTIGIKHREIFNSVSALAPICAPSQAPWGQGAFRAYLGEDVSAWREYDAVELLKAQGYSAPLLVDVGTSDPFLKTELKTELLESTCKEQQVELTLRYRDGYDHGYYFIASVVEEHLRFHHQRLTQT